MADARITQVVVETLDTQDPAAQVSQVVVEALDTQDPDVRVSQLSVEAIDTRSPVCRVTQIVLEYLRPREWVEPPPDPETPGIGQQETERRRIRRMRQAPHLSDEQGWLYYERLQLDLESGVGLTDGQGEDPQVMLQWSDDGGHTWSREHWVSAGRGGAYTWRALWRRLGRSRDRVFRLVISDPVKVTWIDAFMEMERGTS